ncbi:DUF58 domain-containing protein [bacterium]|nr:DUF58 domain-containing protein [bacterium]
MTEPGTREDFRDYLRPETVSRLSRLDLIARLVVEGFITGLHRSPYHGFSAEFSEYRACMPGDPIRHIDWKVLARTERYYVKRFEEETNLRTLLLLDSSGSMGFSSGGVSKLAYARFLAAALTHLMLKQRDAVGLVTFSDTIRSYIPPRSIPGTLNRLLTVMHRLEPEGETDAGTVLHRMAERIGRRSLVIVLSDLLDDAGRVIESLKHLRYRKHEVIVFHILDPAERTLGYGDDTVFIDRETGSRLQTNPWQIRHEYTRQVQEFIDRLRRECGNQRIDYAQIDTDTPFDRALIRYLTSRKRMGG